MSMPVWVALAWVVGVAGMGLWIWTWKDEDKKL